MKTIWKTQLEVTIAIIGTGHPCPEDARYLGTASLSDGKLMFHIFEHMN